MQCWAVSLVRDSWGVVLGWLLGLGTAIIADWWRGRRKAAAAKTAILGEFNELSYRLVGVVFRVESRCGRLDRDLLQWLQSATQRYRGPNRVDLLPAGFAEMLKATDSDLGQLNEFAKDQLKASFFPAEQAPYATAAIAQAHEFDADFAVRVMDVLSHLRMYNEVRESGIQYTHMTFEPGLEQENHALIVENADNADNQLSKRARAIVDKIAALEVEFGSK